MFALVDCNNFFASCERVRHPELMERPVIVLSNNDGCVVAMTNEVKALGIKRGTPLFQIAGLVKRHNIAVLSGEHGFYGECSRRVMRALAELDSGLEVYSIDEAFLHLPDDLGDVEGFGRYVVEKVREDAGIPVSVGIAVTKTLAKVAARFAKKYSGYRGCCLIGDEGQRVKALQLTAIEDVWGIGRRLSKVMRMEGINTAYDLAELERSRVKRLLNVTGERTWRELRGECCMETVSAEEENKSILSSRSFERDLFTVAELRQAVCAFVSVIGKKLRRQRGYAADIEVFVQTNRFHTNAPQYYNRASRSLDEPSDYTPELARVAMALLDRIYRPGYGYKRAGVAVRRVLPGGAVQPGLFDVPGLRDKRRRLMRVTDELNARLRGVQGVRLASMGDGLEGLVRADHRSEERPLEGESGVGSFRSPH